MPKNAESVRQFFRETKIRDAMATSVKKLYETDELSRAQELFVTNRIFYIPVISRDGKLVGLMSHKYLYKTQSPRKFIEGGVNQEYDPEVIIDGDSYYEKSTLNSYILRNMMQHNPYTMGPDENLGDAITAMVKKNLGCIVIVDDRKHVAGLLTDREVLFYAARILQG